MMLHIVLYLPRGSTTAKNTPIIIARPRTPPCHNIIIIELTANRSQPQPPASAPAK